MIHSKQNSLAKVVFLDTEAFIAEGFNFKGIRLDAMRRLAVQGEIYLIMTAGTIKECNSRIQKMISAAKNHLKAKSELGILRQTLLNCDFLKKLDTKALSDEIAVKFEEYLCVCKCERYSSKEILAESVLDDYFSGRPPFGEAQKKDQFPDAVSVMTISEWQRKNLRPVHVISNDKDFVSACKMNSNLILHQNITEFLDEHNRGKSIAIQFINDSIDKNSDKIKTLIQKEFENLGFIVLDEEGDIEDIEVEGITFETSSILAQEDGEATVELGVSVHFTGNLSYEDSSTGYYDREDNIAYFRDVIAKRVDETEKLKAEVTLEWDPADQNELNICVSLNVRDIEIDPRECEDFD